MTQEFWVVGGSYRDTSFVDLEEPAGEVYGPFPSYDAAFRSWRERSTETRAEATTRYTVVVTAASIWR